MANKIGWCDETWNPGIYGCSHSGSPGCDNCYAEKMACRWDSMNKPHYVAVVSGGEWSGTVITLPEVRPPPKGKGKHIFVASMTDLFHEKVAHEFILDVFRTIEHCPQHTFQILTKRPQRMYEFIAGKSGAGLDMPPLPNLWLGVTVCKQEEMWKAIELAKIPAAVRFVCFEPLLDWVVCPFVGMPYPDWLIVGPETGPNRRPCNIEWIRSIVRQCQATGVPPWVKAVPIGNRISHNPEEWDTDLRVRQRPGRNR